MQTEKTITTTLDKVEFGEDVTEESEGKYRRYPIPAGITKKMLISDIVTLAIPSLFEFVLTQLTSMADQIMVGRLPGDLGIQALSAVGLCMNPKFILLVLIIALNTGTTAVIARYRGMGNQEKANSALRTSMILTVTFGIVFSIVGYFCARPLVNLIGGAGISEVSRDYAVTYFEIQMIGFLPLCITSTITSALRAVGDSKMPLIYNTLANVVNLIFNYLLIYGKFGFPYMTVAGASWATIIGQFAAFIMAFLLIISKRRYVYIDFKEKFSFDKESMKNIINIGLPNVGEQAVLRVAIIVYGRMVASLGDMSYATHGICMNIQSLSFMTGMAFANAATALMGQSLGKKRIDMADNYVQISNIMGIAVSVVVGAIMVLWGGVFVGLYNETPEVIETGSKLLMMVGVLQPFQNWNFVISGGLRGAGDTKYPAVVTFLSMMVFRNLVGWLALNFTDLGLIGVWLGIVAEQLIRTALIQVRYRQGKWRFHKLSEGVETA